MSSQEILSYFRNKLKNETEYLFVKSWFKNIESFNFLPNFFDGIQEIIFHTPINIEYRYFNRNDSMDSDITNQDLKIALTMFAQTFNQDWTISNPFCSFFARFRGKDIRATLIHASLSPEQKYKFLFRFHNSNEVGSVAWNLPKNFLKEIVGKKANILISGSTGSGKTTFINGALSFAQDEHIVILEDTYEIQCSKPRVTRFLSQEERNKYQLLDFLKYTSRISPDRIILGELRASEVESFLLALNSGVNGSMATIHSNSAKNALERFAMLFELYSESRMNYELILKLISHNIDYVIHLENKRVKEVINVFGADQNQIFFEKVA